MKKRLKFSVLFVFVSSVLSAQSIKIYPNGLIDLMRSGIPILNLGSSTTAYTDPVTGKYYNNGEWEIDTNGGTGDEMGSLNFGKPWPSAYAGNYKLYLQVDGNIGIGKKNPAYKLDVAGDIATSGQFFQSSDARLKSNIVPLTDKSSDIYKLSGKSYNKTMLPIVDERNKGIFNPDNISLTENKAQQAPKQSVTEFGFLAQDLKEVYPNLVRQNKDGYYSVDYIGLIPIMVEALKEQKLQIESLQQQVVQSSTKNTSISIEALPSLDQNKPNPFSASTEIGFYLPSNVASASLYLYNMNGVQLKNIVIGERGKGVITIQGNELSAGMYIYALIADGKEIDTKRMILTK
jgi:hypothetical protein